MNKMKEFLLKDLKKVPVLPPLRFVVMGLFCLLSLFASLFLYLLGRRVDHALFMDFITMESLLVMVLCIGMLIQFCFAGVPGRRFKGVEYLLGVIWLSLLCIWCWEGPFLMMKKDVLLFYFESTFSCALKVCVMVGLLSFFLRYLQRYFVFLQRSLAGFYLVSTASCVAWWVIGHHCYIMDHMHLLLWHILPVFFCSILGYFLGTTFLKKL